MNRDGLKPPAKRRTRSKLAEEIEEQGVKAWIYPTPSRGRPGWTVCYRFAGHRSRKQFARIEAARIFASKQAERIGRGETGAIGLTREKLAEFRRADELLKGTDGTILLVAARYREDYFKRGRAPSKSVGDAIAEFLAERRAMAAHKDRSTSLRHVAGLEFVLNRFAETFRLPLPMVKPEDIQEWASTLKADDGGALRLRTRHNYVNAVKALFRYALRRRWLTLEQADLVGVKLPAAGPGKISIYSPEELESILACARLKRPDFVPFIAVQAFTGIRTEEMTRLRAENIRGQWIELSAAITKTARRRLVAVPLALRRWLKVHPPARGLLCPVTAATVTGRLCELVTGAGIATRHNGLRDSCITYRMAILKDAARVADESGNSPAMIARSYREVALPDGRLVTPRLAKAWFAVTPARSNIVPMGKTA